jgi:hypothetical protein
MAQFTLPKSPKGMMPAKKVNAILLKQDAATKGEKLQLGGKGKPVLLDPDKDQK